ncbi:MAG TPA: metalloregulator ArsR/SmtB family transcription factor [Cyclobacteriaceae bacterium]|nr:metalloregulator ArsR/SmtB family transcription factor [Cyclobacteriaceae bacterium]
MNKRDFKDKVYTELAKITKSMANPHRLEIIELLAQGEFSVEQIAEQTHLSIANASQHLQVLRVSQLVEIKRQGNFIFYRLSNTNVFKAWKALRELGVERIAAIDKVVKEFRKSKFDFETVTIDELIKKLESGKVTILDVRPDSEYKQGHIANSISIPIEKLSKRLKELPKRGEIIAYCRGPFCVYADEAVALLTKAGYKASRLEEGFPDWKLQELPIEISVN